MKEIFKNDWGPLLKDELQKTYYLKLREFLKHEYGTKRIHPDMFDIFNAFHYTAYQDVKVVLLGQDPYHGPNQAQGLSFSVKPGVPIPPSLRNIFKELHDDLNCKTPNHGSLISWAQQGVMLLNTVLTVREGEAHSHQGRGWEIFTDEVIRMINQKETPVVFLLWGRPAQSKLNLIDTRKHFVLTAAHPSPLSANRGFFGSCPFSKTNQILKEIGEEEIQWQISD